MIHIAGNKSKSILTKVDKESISANAVDLRLGKVFKIKQNVFLIDEEQKIHRGSEIMLPEADGYFLLEPGSYEVIMENIITVAEGEDGFVITRSTLNRNNVFLTSGLYDSGYYGAMAAVMHVGSGNMKIKPGTRIGQYLCFEAESLHMYDGSYGIGKEHDNKYL
jgi:deoxycytidine triphosphate deaminase